MVGHEPTYFNERQINIKIQGKKEETRRGPKREKERQTCCGERMKTNPIESNRPCPVHFENNL